MLVVGSGRPSHVTGIEAKDVEGARVSLSNINCFALLHFEIRIMYADKMILCLSIALRLFQYVELNGQPHKLIRNWRFKTARQHRLEAACSVPLWHRLRHYRDDERPIIAAASSGVAASDDSGRVRGHVFHREA